MMADKFRVSVKLTDDYCTIEELSHASGDEGYAAPVPQVRAERRVNLVKMMKIFGVVLVAGLISLSVYHFIKLNHNEHELEELRNAIYMLTSNNSALQSQYTTLFSNLKQFYCDATNTFPNKTCFICKPDWIPFSSKCYYFSTIKLSWKNSSDWCETRGGRLVNIESLEEQDFLKGKGKQNYYWIGRYNISKENKSTRMDGAPVKSKRASDDDEEQCLSIWLHDSDMINVKTFNCENTQNWICESAAFPLRI